MTFHSAVSVARSLLTAVSAILPALMPLSAQTIRQTVVHYPAGGVTPGFGWNLTYDAPSTAECLIYDTQTATGQVLTEHFSRVADTNSLFRSLQISTSAKMKSAVGSGGLEAQFAKTSQIDDSRLTISIDEEVRNGPIFVVPKGANGDPDVNVRATFASGAFTLKPWAAALLSSGKTSDRLKFLQRCGNGYVQSVSKGARLIGSFSLHTHSDAESQQIATSAQGGGMGASFSASLNSIVNDKATLSTLLIDVAKMGGNGDPAPISETDIDQLISNLPLQAKNNPSAIELIVRSYDGVVGYRAQAPSGDSDADALADAYFDTEDYVRIVTGVIDNFSNYSPLSGVALQDLKDDSDIANAALQKQAVAIQLCINDAAKCSHLNFPKVDIYALRSHLPVLAGEDPVDSAVQNALSMYSADLSRLQQLNAQCTPRCGDGASGQIRAAQQSYLRQQKLPSDVAQFNALSANLAESMASTRIVHWVRERRDTLCALYPERPCLSYHEMDALKAAIKAKIVLPFINLAPARAAGASV